MKIQEVQAKSILVASLLPNTDYVLNPYTGCSFGCSYCYASFMGRFVGESIASWGEYVYVKMNAVELLEQDLVRWSPKRRTRTLLLSSVTDPYDGIESKYRLTRGLLGVLAREQYPGTVSILTKSPLVLRDIDLLLTLPDVEVGMTVTTTDDRLSRFLEVRAPLASRRLKTLTELTRRGVRTYAFVGPLLPHFCVQPALLEKLIASIAAAGVTCVYVEHMNLKPYIRERLCRHLQDEPQEVRSIYAAAATKSHRQELDRMIASLLNRYGLTLRLGRVLEHDAAAGIR